MKKSMPDLSAGPTKTKAVKHSGYLGILAVAIALLSFTFYANAQTTVSTGAIRGTVTDPAGALVTGANVTIRSKSTAQTIATTTNGAGVYSSGSLIQEITKSELPRMDLRHLF